jgi:uncharacterized protein (TIGR02145 family)
MERKNLRLTMRHRLRFAEANSRAVMPENGNQSNALTLSKQKWINKSMLLLVALFIFTSVVLKAQSPQKINFQSIVRNTSGVIVSNKSVKFKITILADSTTGTPVYSETHLKTTDAIGLVSLQIGSGTVTNGVFSSLNWGNASHFIKLEADFSGGNTYVTLGTQELMSVPYAMYAAKTDTASLNLTNRFAEKAPVNNPEFTGTVYGITQTMVGLDNVNNTSDASKPVSTATQTVLALKAPLASPTFTGTVSGIDKTMVGLGNVDNTTDASKPVSSATQTALALKAPLASPTFTGTVGGITKAMVGLENVDNTTDASKPVSTLTQTALAMKVNISDTSDMLDKYLRKADFPSGSNVGDFMYWNGTNWVGLAPGTTGQVLIISSTGTPNWGCPITNSAGTPSTTPTLTVNTSLTPITIATTGATGIAQITEGLPPGVTATWSANEITISGTPTAAGNFEYKILLTGGCGTAIATGTITVTCVTNNTAAAPSSSPTLEVNTALTAPITIATTGATGIDTIASGLPPGVTATWSADVITISGTPTTSGTFTYEILLTGGCGNVYATGSITGATVPGDIADVVVTDGLEEGEVIVTFSPPLSDGGSPIIEYEVEATEEEVPDVNSPTISSYSPKNILIENITITSNDIPLTMAEDTNEPVSGFVVSSIIRTKGLKSPITVKGLKISVSYIFKVFAKNLIGSSPPPSTGKTQKFTPKVFLCAAGSASSSPSLIQNTPLTDITHKTTKATGIGSTAGLPQGVTAAWSGNTITISGTPAAAGVFNYTIPITGTSCNNVIATGTITVNVAPCPATITYNSYTYKTVGIGNQCWMAENLRTRKYNDGTDIPFDASGGASGNGSGQKWSKLTTGAHTLYAHDSTASPSNLTSYGYLYNWYAVNDSRKLCPSGWNVPTDAEWTILINTLGGNNVAGDKMKSMGTDYWNSTNTGADNSSGFSALPGGYRFGADGHPSNGEFKQISLNAFFWSATRGNEKETAFYRRLGSSNGDVYRLQDLYKSVGASIRCLRD